jgi:hypothetical protein
MENRGNELSLIGLNRLVPLVGLASFAAILFGIKLLLISTYGNATPYWDQWDSEAHGLYMSLLDGRLGWEELVAAHNEHRILIPRLLAIGLLSANGLWNPLLQMVVNAGLHVGLACLLVSLLTRIVGRRFLPVILTFCLPLFGWPYGWENTLAGFQSCFYFLLLFSIGSIWLIVGAASLSARWWTGTVLATCGFFSLASGVFALAALAALGAVQYFVGVRTSRLHVASVLALGGLFVLGVALTPAIAHHASLKAATISQLLYSLDGVLGWPIRVTILGPVLRNAPAVIFATVMLRLRPPANDRRWFLLGLVILMVGQSLAIAHGRATGFVAPRYKDLFAIDVLTNFACLLILVHDVAGTRRWAAPAAAAWTAVVLGCLGSSVHKHCGHDLQQRLETAQSQECNTRNYVLTGDKKHFEDKPFLHVPHPRPDHLAAVLDNPLVRAILPRNIGEPLKGSILETGSEAAGTLGGYGPKTPTSMAPAWGTYGTAGAATTGTGCITFAAVHRGYAVEIPVAGNSRAEGIVLEVEQDGRRWPLRAVGESNETWGVATATVRGRPFTLHITDTNPNAWIAVGSPVAMGRWDNQVDRLLARWDVFVIVGSVMAVAVLTFVSLAPAKPVL